MTQVTFPNTEERKPFYTMQEIVMTGKTVEEAVEAACTSLDLSRDEVNVEILEVPQKRLFGSTLAKVRVYSNTDDFSMNDLLPQKENKPVEEESHNETVEIIETVVIPEVKKEVVVIEEIIEEPKEPEVVETKVVQPEPEIVSVKEEVKESEIAFEDMPISAKAAYSYLIEIAKNMNLSNITFKAISFEEGIKLVADGEDAAALIGRRGETMDALQYLCLLVGNRAGGEYCKISLDVANYRIRREQSLESQAKRIADKVLKTRRSQTLDSMSAYERRIIHSTIQNIKGVGSESIGSEPNRRVVVFPEGDRRNNSKGYKGKNNNQSSNRGKGNNQSKPSVLEKKKEELRPQNELLEKNLYGKIDI